MTTLLRCPYIFGEEIEFHGFGSEGVGLFDILNTSVRCVGVYYASQSRLNRDV